MSFLHPLSTATRRVAVGIAALLAVTLTAVFGLGAFTQASATMPSDNSPKPTIVLVHGAWDNSSGWDTVVTELQQDGYPVIAPADPLRDLASDSAYISSVLDTITGPIILVGHSYGARSSPTPRSATPTSKRSSTSPVGRSDEGTQSPNSSPSTPAA